MLSPVFVTVVPARTAKLAAVPSGTGTVSALALVGATTSTSRVVAQARTSAVADRPIAVSLRRVTAGRSRTIALLAVTPIGLNRMIGILIAINAVNRSR